MTVPRDPWDRLAVESSRAYAMFRRFRDLGPLRRLDMLDEPGIAPRTVARWSKDHDWKDRASAWDDEVHRLSDAQRLESIRSMHDLHARTGRVILTKALAALSQVAPEDIPPYAAARLLELGARLERDTLVTSVEALQGIAPPPVEDPWEAIARELDTVPDAP